MKKFHISDVLTVTSGRLVSSRHMDGAYEILNFLTGDNLFTHQLPRALKECESWLRGQFPLLMENSPGMSERLAILDEKLREAGGDRGRIIAVIQDWVEQLRFDMALPEMIPVYEMGRDMHTHIDPVEEAKAMIGDANVIVVKED